jgi:hypothetical protein
MSISQKKKSTSSNQKRIQKEMKHKTKTVAIQKVPLPAEIPTQKPKMSFWRKLMLSLRLRTE